MFANFMNGREDLKQNYYYYCLTPESRGHVRNLAFIQIVLVRLDSVPFCGRSSSIDGEGPQSHLVGGPSLQPHKCVQTSVSCCGYRVSPPITSVSFPVPQFVSCNDAIATLMWRCFPSHCHTLKITFIFVFCKNMETDNSSTNYLTTEMSMRQGCTFRTRIRISKEIMKTLKCTIYLVTISFESYFVQSLCFGWQ